ncbi:MAG: multicopper oxidase domain-containing protein [Acidobacteria bacterium]|nr:multicopper oxidase domain-containing protein [Acidobacteriota bacterium]
MKRSFNPFDEIKGNRILNRRDFLQLATLGVTVLGTEGFPFSSIKADSPATAFQTSSTFDPDVEIDLQATPADVSLFPGQPTRVWTYQAALLKGDSGSIETIAGSYLGPVIRVHQGQNIRINFRNDLPEASVIHWHGLRLSSEMDAHPRYLINPGQIYVYEFQVRNRAGTYWFHPHPDGRTGPQVYHGLAGLFLVSDDEESATRLPSGEHDLPLVIQDRLFDGNHQLSYQTGGMMNGMDGFLGNQILVNGKPDYVLPVATRAYRLRLVNGSNSRVYKLAWSHGAPMAVIGTDGGLLEAPLWREYVMLAPGERIEIVVDFQKFPVGSTMRLLSLGFSGAESGMMGGGASLTNGAPFTVMNVVVVRKEKVGKFAVPSTLSTISRHRLEDAVNRDKPRTFSTSFNRMAWVLNGRRFAMNEVAENEIVQLGTLEAWNLVNDAGSARMMGMRMMHPIHIHGVQFQVIERQITPGFASGWNTVRAGYVDEGWKDTVLLMPGERVKLLLKFEDYSGLFVYHCHNLEHEDAGMMRNFLIRA